MFDIGAPELLVIAVVAILVVRPKDLPRMLRTIGQYVGKLRSMAREFQNQFEEAARDTGLDDVRNSISNVQDFSPTGQAKKAFNSIVEDVESVKSDVEKPHDESPVETSPEPDAGAASTASEAAAPEAKPAAAPKKTAAKKPAAKKPAAKKPAAKKPAATKKPAASKAANG